MSEIEENKAASEIESTVEKTAFIVKKEEEKQTDWFRILGLSSILYAVIFSFCYHRNTAGIAIPVWFAATIGYVTYIMKKVDVQKKKDSIFYVSGMILLGISTFLTGNPYIIFMNYAGFFLLLVSWLLHNFKEDAGWDFTRYLSEIGTAVLGAIECIPNPFMEATDFFHTKKAYEDKTKRNMFSGLLLAIPAVCFLIVLLSEADAVFGSWIHNIFGAFHTPDEAVEILLLLVFGFFSSYCGMRCMLTKRKERKVTVNQKDPIGAISFTMVITVLYLVFSAIQIFYLFLGYGSLPEGMTYAEYARTGFFQLLFVSLMNLFLVLWIRKHIRRNRMLDQILLTICACTFIMIASSAYRMLLYIGVYQLTFLRVFVLVALAVIALIMAGAVIYLFRQEFPMFRYSMLLVSVIYLCFSFSHVDYFIAKYNLTHMTEHTKYETLEYIGTLSTDAAPVIMEYVENEAGLKERLQQAKKQMAQEGYRDSLYSIDDDLIWYILYQSKCQCKSVNLGIRTFNVSYYIASQLEW